MDPLRDYPASVKNDDIAPDTSTSSSRSIPERRTALTFLMDAAHAKKKRPQTSSIKSVSTRSNPFGPPYSGRDGLGMYLASPNDSPLFLYQTPFAVAIRDLYPKSSVHALLLPRDPSKTLEHPLSALSDATFLNTVKEEAEQLRRLVASQLRHKYGAFSKTDRVRRDAMDAATGAGTDLPNLPQGRDWEKDVLVGVHARPSMNHLHIHVISVDRVSEFVRHRKHYNSFATPFLVRLDEFPLAPDDVRLKSGCGGYLERDLTCWRCGKNFGNKFTNLKLHLEEELKDWRTE